MQHGSYQFEELHSREMEATYLAERAQLRLDGFIELLHRHHVPTHGNILDVGCAQGIRTHVMAKQFPQANVIGIDRSAELLQVACDHDGDVSNLSFQSADLYDLPFPDNSMDFVYARLVFMHLVDPIRALQSLKRVLRPGGRVLIEDADRDCMFFEPRPSSFNHFWQQVQAGQRRLGGDPNVGRKLASYLKEVAFQHVQIEMQPIVGGGDDIAFLVRTLLPSLNLYLPEEERAAGNRAIQDLRALSQDARACFYHLWFVVSGEK